MENLEHAHGVVVGGYIPSSWSSLLCGGSCSLVAVENRRTGMEIGDNFSLGNGCFGKLDNELMGGLKIAAVADTVVFPVVIFLFVFREILLICLLISLFLR